jgi:serine/threonine-protein kinase
MGIVYRAHDTHLDREVALKILRAGDDEESSQKETGAARLLREGRAAAAIQHPSAVAIFDVGEEAGTPFMAMELVEGAQLRAFVGDVRVPLARRVRWLLEIASALAAAHKRGVVHRDVKPENVIIGSDHSVKVLDFGIARRATAGVPLALGARDSTVFGSPRYMAPEQLRGEALDGRTDQFAWGIVAFELLTGRHPWESADSDLALAKLILGRDVERPSLLAPDVPPEIDAVVARATQKDVAGRFASMGELMARLRALAIAEERPDEAAAPSPESAESSGPVGFTRRLGRSFRSITTRTFGMTASGATWTAPRTAARVALGLALTLATITLVVYAARRGTHALDATSPEAAVQASAPPPDTAIDARVDVPTVPADMAVDAAAAAIVDGGAARPTARPQGPSTLPRARETPEAPPASPPAPAPSSSTKAPPALNTEWR